MENIIYKSSPIGELVDADEKTGIVKGYGSIFNNVDSDGDVITPGAYTKTIMENGKRVKYLYQHNMEQPLGKMNNLYEDDKGLMFEAKIPKTQLGSDVLELMKAGVITENSVGILPLQKEAGNGENYNRKLTDNTGKSSNIPRRTMKDLSEMLDRIDLSASVDLSADFN